MNVKLNLISGRINRSNSSCSSIAVALVVGIVPVVVK